MPQRESLTRAEFLAASLAGAAALALPAGAQQTPPTTTPNTTPGIVPATPNVPQTPATPLEIDADLIARAEPLVGVNYPADARRPIVGSVKATRKALDKLRQTSFDNVVSPAFVFEVEGKQPKPGDTKDVRLARRKTLLPSQPDALAFLSVGELAELLKGRQITSTDLTKYFLARLEKYGPLLNCVITMTPDRALRTAAEADKLFAKGIVRSPLQGVPTGVKDLFAMLGTPTTWGAEPYRNQVLPYDAAVVERLDLALCPILAKTSLGALAYGDVWFGGLTKNPWNPKQGSSGSSAGSASAVAAGLLPFAIGTETLGSVVSPSQRCRTFGLRPTFGRTSRYGAMALSWTMDKVGVLARNAEDSALVLAAMCGADPRDPASVDRPFSYRPMSSLKGLKIAIVGMDSESADDAVGSGRDGEVTAAVQVLRELGATIAPGAFTPVPNGVSEVLTVEAASAFDELTRSGAVDTMKGSLWPPAFRAAMYVTGVDYIQAMRARRVAMALFERELGDFDLVLAPGNGGNLLVTTNLTGHPQTYIPMGLDRDQRPIGLSLIGRLYDEGRLLGVAQILHDRFGAAKLRPDLSALEPK